MKKIKQLTALVLVYLIVINSFLASFAADTESINDVAASLSSLQTENFEKNTDDSVEENASDELYYFVIYTYNGQSFNVKSNSVARLSDIFRELNISCNISDVASVSVNDPDVLKLTEVDSDWELVAPGPFGSEQTLTIVFYSGESIEITVKDPVVYNYVLDSNITNVPIRATQTRIIKDVIDPPDSYDQTHNGKKTFKVNKDNILNPSASTDIIVYASPGMAIRFEGGNTWNSKPGLNDAGMWYWFWASSTINGASLENSNFAVIREGTAGQHVTFSYKVNNKSITVNVTLCSVVTYTAQEGTDKQANLLENNNNLPDGYLVKSLPITLYDYDGKKFNSYYESKGGNYFAFHSYSQGVDAKGGLSKFGWNGSANTGVNSGGDAALMGIVKEDLENGLPVMSQGQNVDLFSTNTLNGAKTVYENVDFQFVYNESTGYYTYNSSLNHAQYNPDNKTVELYKHSLAPSDSFYNLSESHFNAGFYPFTDINKSYTNPGYTAITEEQWKSKLEGDFGLLTAQYSADIVDTKATNPASTVNMHFGLQLSCDFYLPEGKQINEQDMVFNFTGDDDLWVFVDDKLVLDIGGGHTHISGNFNLTTGAVYVSSYAQLNAAGGGSYATYKRGFHFSDPEITSFLNSLKADQMHNIKIFYLERHGGVSNCYMHFNLPVIPSNTISVSKNLMSHDGGKLSVTPNTEYTFTVYTAEDTDDNGDATGFSAYINQPFTIIGDSAPVEIQYTDNNGQFRLKSGWIARFPDVARFTNVYVIESRPTDDYVYTHSTVEVNRGTPTEYQFDTKTVTKVMQSNSSVDFAFVNYIQTQSLTIEKQVVNGLQGLIDPNQKFDFKLNFTKEIIETGENLVSPADVADSFLALTNNGSFQLGHNESITLPRVPVNMTFTLKEVNPDKQNGSFDAPVFTFTNCTTEEVPNAFDTEYTWTVRDSGANSIVVENQQRFNLTITNTGISDVDHNNDEQQSTIYTLVGRIGDEEIRLNVAICGNDEITICGLPVGVYTVEENTAWAWRYEVIDGAVKNVNISQDAQANVSYENSRANSFWSSGDCYVENWFTFGEVKKRNGEDDVTE